MDKRVVKKFLSDKLMDLCEKERLDELTVTALAQAAGVSRQTVYNHFASFDDLVCYAASLPFLMNKVPFFSAENTRLAYLAILDHKPFFSQLPSQRGFKAKMTSWQCELCYRFYLSDELGAEERLYRRIAIDFCAAGSVEVLMNWCEEGMVTPVDALIQVFIDLVPAFMYDAMESAPLDPGGHFGAVKF